MSENAETRTVRCPRSPYSAYLWLAGEVEGCGHVFTDVPDDEGLFDCPECGIWFNPDDPNNAPYQPSESDGTQ